MLSGEQSYRDEEEEDEEKAVAATYPQGDVLDRGKKIPE